MKVECDLPCPNAAQYYYKGKYLCSPHYLAATADGQLLNTILIGKELHHD